MFGVAGDSSGQPLTAGELPDHSRTVSRQLPGPLHPYARAMRTEPTGKKELIVAVDEGSTVDGLVELLCEGIPVDLRVKGIRTETVSGSVELVLARGPEGEGGGAG